MARTAVFASAFGAPMHIMSREVDGSGTFQWTCEERGILALSSELGGGNRVCLGMPFALYEMKVLLATLLSQVRPSRPAGARSRARRYGIVLGPDDGGRVIVRPTTW